MRRYAYALFLLLAALVAWSSGDLTLGEGRETEGRLIVEFLDVGQGDAALIHAPAGQVILVDGGPDPYRLGEELVSHLPWERRRIDLLILTHPHADHVGGLVGIFDRYEVGRVLYTGVVHTAPAYLKWLEEAKAASTTVVIAAGQRTIDLGPDTGIDILWPREDLSGHSVADLNNSSIVFRLRYGQTSALFTGDAETPVEKSLIASKLDIRADILKVAHHGSVTATSEEFLSAIAPARAVISVGEGNEFGHPSGRIVNRLERAGAAVYRTDRDGTVHFASDGREWREAP